MSCLIPLALGAESPTKRYSVFFADSEDMLRRYKGAHSNQNDRTKSRTGSKKMEHARPLSSHQHKTPSMPCTNVAWISTLADIKRDYMSKRFSQCALRCQNILSHDKSLDTAHPVYLVYLRFYAATSLEMQARATQQSSPYRSALLKQAHDHYCVASDLAKKADEDMSRPSSRLSSPRLHSSSESNVSGSTASTRMSSPAPSLASIEGTPKSRKKKRVAFCDEPIIRPDSPTLGFDEWLGRSSPEPPAYPESILKTAKSAFPLPVSDMALSPVLSEPEDVDPFFHTRSIHRLCSILGSIRRQIAAHMKALDAELAACKMPVPAATAAHASRELKDLDIKARIERLRACGWNRPRFDAQRYESLCENALTDMLE